MVPVTVTGTVADATSGVNPASVTFVVSDKYGLTQPSGPVTLGANGSYSFSIPLQASRLGNDLAGRLYTITLTAQDNAGNTATSTAPVIVPHDGGIIESRRIG